MSQERSARTRRLLLDAAAREFAAHGYSGARLQTVVNRIGMTKGALYGHFASKEDLAAGVAAEAALAWEALRGELAASALDAGKELRFLAERLARLMDDDTAFRAAVRLTVEGLREPAAGGLLTAISAHTTTLVRRAQAEQALAVGLTARRARRSAHRRDLRGRPVRRRAPHRPPHPTDRALGTARPGLPGRPPDVDVPH